MMPGPVKRLQRRDPVPDPAGGRRRARVEPQERFHPAPRSRQPLGRLHLRASSPPRRADRPPRRDAAGHALWAASAPIASNRRNSSGVGRRGRSAATCPRRIRDRGTVQQTAPIRGSDIVRAHCRGRSSWHAGSSHRARGAVDARGRPVLSAGSRRNGLQAAPLPPVSSARSNHGRRVPASSRTRALERAARVPRAHVPSGDPPAPGLQKGPSGARTADLGLGQQQACNKAPPGPEAAFGRCRFDQQVDQRILGCLPERRGKARHRPGNNPRRVGRGRIQRLARRCRDSRACGHGGGRRPEACAASTRFTGGGCGVVQPVNRRQRASCAAPPAPGRSAARSLIGIQPSRMISCESFAWRREIGAENGPT